MGTAITQLKAGDKVRIGYRGHRSEATFLGFSSTHSKYGESGPVFASMEVVGKVYGVDTLAQLCAFNEGTEKEKGYGHKVYAIFADPDAGDTFTAYTYKGRWCLGSSADRAEVERV